VADLRSRFIEDYAGGLLNVARQDLSSTGEVLAQDGFVDNLTYFVEDGRGVKSGLRLGASLVESVDPTSELGVLNVRTADRTYAKIRELKIFATAVASAQGALSQSVSESFLNLESAFESLESDVSSYRGEFLQEINRSNTSIDQNRQSIAGLTSVTEGNSESIVSLTGQVNQIQGTVDALERGRSGTELVLRTAPIPEGESIDLNLQLPLYYGIISIESDLPSWITLYGSESARVQDTREDETTTFNGVVVDAVTTLESKVVSFLPLTLAYSENGTVYVRVVNNFSSGRAFNIKLKYIAI
jgi:hypothetical protein